MSIPIEKVTEGWWWVVGDNDGIDVALVVRISDDDYIFPKSELKSGDLAVVTDDFGDKEYAPLGMFDFICKIPLPDEIKEQIAVIAQQHGALHAILGHNERTTEKLQSAIDTLHEITLQSECNAHKLAKEWLKENEENRHV